MKVAFTVDEINRILADRAAKLLDAPSTPATALWRYGANADGRDILEQVEVEFAPEQTTTQTGTSDAEHLENPKGGFGK